MVAINDQRSLRLRLLKLTLIYFILCLQLFAHLDFDEDGKVTEDDLRSLVYCDFADPKSSDKPYTEARDLEHLRTIVEGYLDEFNNMSKKPMHLVLFRYSLFPPISTITSPAC